jgi:hypothetical protein
MEGMDGDAPSTNPLDPLAVPGDETMDVPWDETKPTQPLDCQYITITNGGVRLHEYSSDSTHYLCVCGAFVGCLISDGDDTMDSGDDGVPAAAAAAPTAPSEEEMRAIIERSNLEATNSLMDELSKLQPTELQEYINNRKEQQARRAKTADSIKKSQAEVLAHSKKAAEAHRQSIATTLQQNAETAKPHNAVVEPMAATATRPRRNAMSVRTAAGRH